MTNSIPKRGPVTIKLSDGSLELWYNRDIRLWTLQQLDAEGNQIGPNRTSRNSYTSNSEASYHHNRNDAVDEMKSIALADRLIGEVVAEEKAEDALVTEFKLINAQYEQVCKKLDDHFLGEADRLTKLYANEPRKAIRAMEDLLVRCPGDSVTKVFLMDRLRQLKLR